MLLIAVGFGSLTDPFTTSTWCPNGGTDPKTGQALDVSNADDCRSYICKEKDLKPEWVDEVLVVDVNDEKFTSDFGEPQVIHHHSEFSDDNEDDES